VLERQYVRPVNNGLIDLIHVLEADSQSVPQANNGLIDLIRALRQQHQQPALPVQIAILAKHALMVIASAKQLIR
jgi:hypothetical protein